MACSTEQLLVFDNSPVFLEAPGKRPQEDTPHLLGNCVLLAPPSPRYFRCPPWGVQIFYGTTQFWSLLSSAL